MGTAGSVQRPLKSKRSVEKTIKTEKKLENLDIQHYDKDNLHLLHDMFLGLDPTMRVFLEEERGTVKVSTFYDRRSEHLKVKVHSVTGIRSCNVRADTCDPYFKVFLTNEQDGEGDPAVFTTRVAEQALEAVYEELFQFSLPSAAVDTTSLTLELWDFSELIEPGELLGSVLIDTRELIKKPVTQSYSIQPKVNTQAGGDVQFNVRYNDQDSSLTLSSLRTENLRVGDNLCVMCRVLLTRKDKFYETVENPVFDKICCWDEEYSFKVPREDLEKRPQVDAEVVLRNQLLSQTSFLITVFSVNGKGDRHCLGQAIAPLTGLELNKDIVFRRPLADLTQQYRKHRESLVYAHLLHELRDAYVAHTVAKAPQAVFGGALLNENKKVKLSCRKAGCSSKRVLYNGKLRSS